MVKFKDFSRPLSVFQKLFKANLIFKDFSRQSYIFKHFEGSYRLDKTKFTDIFPDANPNFPDITFPVGETWLYSKLCV